MMILSSAFNGCTNLNSVIFEKGSKLTTICSWAFMSCTSLTNIKLPNGLTSIESNVFGGCTNLKKVEIPASVTYIGHYSFMGCTALTIYCEAEEMPSSWEIQWNIDKCPVVWGYNK